MTRVLADILTPPKWGMGSLKVWHRNFRYFRYTFGASLFWVVFEPTLYLFAIGFGLGQFVGQIDNIPYVEFFFPALLATSAMSVSFFEGTYGCYTKFATQKTYDTIMLTPVSVDELILGEILWTSSKGFLSVIGISIVALLFGLGTQWMMLPVVLILWVLCWTFAAFGLLMTSFARSYESFIYSGSGIIMPMALFSGTYFPLHYLPSPVQWMAYLLPLTHAIQPLRALLFSGSTQFLLLHLVLLGGFAIFLTNWAASRMRRKLYF